MAMKLSSKARLPPASSGQRRIASLIGCDRWCSGARCLSGRPLLRAAADAHAPIVRARFKIFPGELIGALGLELIKQRLGIVVIDQDKAFARRQGFKGAKDERVALSWRRC